MGLLEQAIYSEEKKNIVDPKEEGLSYLVGDIN